MKADSIYLYESLNSIFATHYRYYIGFQWIVLFICIFYCLRILKENLQLPPGPWGIPILGYLPWTSSPSPHYTYVQLANKFGDIFSVRLGSQLIVGISSVDLLRTLFNRSESIARPQTPLNRVLSGFGIVLSEGALWKAQRQFLVTKFRLLGANLSGYNERLESSMLREIEEFLADLSLEEGTPIDPADRLGRHIHNIICTFVMSHRFKAGDEHFKYFNKKVQDGMRLYGQLLASEYITGYMYLPGKRKILNQIAQNHKDMSAFHLGHVEMRRKQRALHGAGEPADLLDCYLEEMEKLSNAKKNIFNGVNEDSQLVQVMNDLFSAGMETSRSALLWILVIMVREPKVVKRVQDELKMVVDRGELVMLKHRQLLVYTEAVIWETLRRTYVVPLGTTHVNSIDWLVNGYKIPAGSQIIPLINKIHMDQRAFAEPELFKPERFIDEDGKLNYSNNYFMPFGVGRRICLGDNVARMELFLFFANIMNNIDLSLPEGHELPSLEGEMGSTHTPNQFKLMFKVLRKKNKKLDKSNGKNSSQME